MDPQKENQVGEPTLFTHKLLVFEWEVGYMQAFFKKKMLFEMQLLP